MGGRRKVAAAAVAVLILAGLVAWSASRPRPLSAEERPLVGRWVDRRVGLRYELRGDRTVWVDGSTEPVLCARWRVAGGRFETRSVGVLPFLSGPTASDPCPFAWDGPDAFLLSAPASYPNPTVARHERVRGS